jgi:hypothetical protein
MIKGNVNNIELPLSKANKKGPDAAVKAKSNTTYMKGNLNFL